MISILNISKEHFSEIQPLCSGNYLQAGVQLSQYKSQEQQKLKSNLFRILTYIEIVFLATLISCSSKDDYYLNQIQNALELEIEEEYKVVEKSSSSAIGDYTETFTIQFESRDFNYIRNRLDMEKLERSLDGDFLYLNNDYQNGDRVSIVINPKSRTIKYTFADI